MKKAMPPYPIPILPREQLLENLLSPCRVLLRYARVPSIQQVEFDGDGVPFASGCERMIEIPGKLESRGSTADQTLWQR